ncbi:malate synthase A-like protein [Dinothrombium tinctorium]|uniref:Malate synthase n=1 Tax=Dinothrombium tinctorium TaxID=1965070 RepID=A0A3S4R6X1_9ACAR|nr:malate synthase A-like protein [Dinothrombium tinctorium]RWS12347.1 malate synthase A-like protein [Dinothrombium tinctorium]
MSTPKMSSKVNGVEVKGEVKPEYEEILTPDALSFVAKLHRSFNATRLNLLEERAKRQKRLDAGERPDFLDSTRGIRESKWTIAPLPKDLLCRRVEITGPPERKMIINAFNSGSDAYMCDFEDSNTPSWQNQIEGQINLKKAIRRNLQFTDEKGKEYKLNDKIATLSVRPRGWHLSEKHVLIDGERTSGSLLDFGLFFYHNAKEQLVRGSGPYFYLPKLESHHEARLWNDVFVFAQKELGIAQGTIKATVLIETILAALEMEEILYELRDHSAGLNAGRWDYIFSCIKKFQHNPDFVFADRGLITMNTSFMRAYCLQLVKSCHKREAPAIGGMSALIPIRNDPAANEKAMNGVRADKARDANDGFDGGWIAHPGLVDVAMEEFKKVLGDRLNQIDKKRDDVNVTAKDLLDFGPNKPITEQGLKMNISVGIRYLGSWLAGTGCVPIFNLMEDAATAEISRSQVWQWVHSKNGVLDDGRKVTVELVHCLIENEIETLKSDPRIDYYKKAAQIFEDIVKKDSLEEFLTLPLYENL